MDTNKIELVKSYILKEAREGRLKKGQRLPSCRQLSSILGINKITVNKGYNQLEREHVVYSIPRGGFYFMDSDEAIKASEDIVDFKTVKPDNKCIPYREFTHVMNRAVDIYQNSLFSYDTAGGLASLRDTLKGEFEKDGIYTYPEGIIITHGAQQAIGLVLQWVFSKAKGKLLVEAPTYNLVLSLARHLDINVVGIERRIDGFDLTEMERLFKSGDITAFYIVPRHHNPTGYSLRERDKQRIAQLSNRYNVLIIEDDYLADLGSRKGSLPIHYYDINKSTVYIRSFSKTFMPGIRIGAAILPKGMLEGVVKLKHITDLNTSLIPQAALDLFIKSGMYQKHIKRVRKSYEGKLRRAAEIFKAFSLKDISWHVPDHGIFIWLELPKTRQVAVFERKLQQLGIYIMDAAEFYPEGWLVNNCSSNYIRLCISGVSYNKIDSLATIISALGD